MAWRRPTAADDHRVEKQLTFVDEIGFERKPRKLAAANADVVLRFTMLEAGLAPSSNPLRVGVDNIQLVPIDP
jgi:hypothetical protein